jgi:hypothetical protein
MIVAIAFGVIGVLRDELSWAEAGGVAGMVIAAYIAAVAVKQALIALGK